MFRVIRSYSAAVLLSGLCVACASSESRNVGDTASLVGSTSQTALSVREPDGEKSGGKKDPASELVRIGADIEGRGDKATAITLYERAVDVSRGRSDMRLQLAAAYERAQRSDDALQVYRTILEAEPENGLALVNLGSALVKRGSLDQGVAALAKAAPLLKSPGAYDRLGVAQTLLGRPQEAVVSLARAYELAPGDLDVKTNLALATALIGKRDGAVALMKEVVQEPKALPHHRRNLVLVLGLAKREAEALTLASADLPKSEIEKLLKRAEGIHNLGNPKAQAKALGPTL